MARKLDDMMAALPKDRQKRVEARTMELATLTIERGRGAKGDRVRAEILKRQRPFSISDIEESCPGISRDMVRVILRAMKSEGLIEPNGKGRGAKWQQKHDC